MLDDLVLLRAERGDERLAHLQRPVVGPLTGDLAVPLFDGGGVLRELKAARAQVTASNARIQGEALRLDPLEFRLRNVSRPGDPMPDGVILPSVSLADILQQVRHHPCWTTPLTGPHQGRGIALGLWTNPGGTTSCHLALNADGSKLYTANGPSGDVSIIDVASGKVEKKVSTGGSPWGVVVVTRK